MEKECSWEPELEKAWYYGSTLSFEEALILIKQM